jgi:hypothetical protein
MNITFNDNGDGTVTPVGVYKSTPGSLSVIVISRNTLPEGAPAPALPLRDWRAHGIRERMERFSRERVGKTLRQGGVNTSKLAFVHLDFSKQCHKAASHFGQVTNTNL